MATDTRRSHPGQQVRDEQNSPRSRRSIVENEAEIQQDILRHLATAIEERIPEAAAELLSLEAECQLHDLNKISGCAMAVTINARLESARPVSSMDPETTPVCSITVTRVIICAIDATGVVQRHERERRKRLEDG